MNTIDTNFLMPAYLIGIVFIFIFLIVREDKLIS